MTAQLLYVDAEVEYRLGRAAAQFPHPVRHLRGRRHKVRRRPSLHLPTPRRRPLAVA